VKNLIDPDFKYATAITQLWGLIVLRLSGDEILPFDHYEQTKVLLHKFEIFKNNTELTTYYNSLSASQKTIFTNTLNSISRAFEKYTESTNKFTDYLNLILSGKKSKPNYELIVRYLNDKMMLLERSFLSNDGLATRNWYKHTLTAPGRYLGYSYEMFPGVFDAIRDLQFQDVIDAMYQISFAVTSASQILNVQ